MAVAASTAFRLSVLVALGLFAVAAFVDPRRGEPRPERVRAEPLPVERPTSHGLVAIDSRALFRKIRHSNARGVVVTVWASWCGSCQEDVPLILGLGRRFEGNLDVLVVSVDEPTTRAKAAEMLKAFGASGPAYVIDEPLPTFKVAMNPRWPGMLPATFLYDRAGKLRYFWGGPVTEGDIVPLLQRYLAGAHVDGEANFALAPGAVTR